MKKLILILAIFLTLGCIEPAPEENNDLPDLHHRPRYDIPLEP